MDLVLQALTRFWVADLQSTYTALPINQVAVWMSREPGEVESYIQGLIHSGHLTATIDKSPHTHMTSSANLSSSITPSSMKNKTPSSSTAISDLPPSSDNQTNDNGNLVTSSVLRFYSEDDSVGPFAKTEKERYDALAAQVERTNSLAEQVKLAEARLTLTREYVEFLRRKRTHRNSEREGDRRGVGGDGVDDEMLVDGGGAGGGGGSGMWERDDRVADAGDTGMHEDDDDDDDEQDDGDDTMDDLR